MNYNELAACFCSQKENGAVKIKNIKIEKNFNG